MIENISIVMSRLTDLGIDCILVGGVSVGLLVTDPAAPKPRHTVDVDVLVDVQHRSDYDRLSAKLREAGYEQPIGDEHPICRWLIEGIQLDLMPPMPEILGFTNRWYKSALANTLIHQLPDGTSIRIIDAPHFLASKLEAYRSRGQDDPLMSSDLTDIFLILDARAELEEELGRASFELKRFVSRQLKALLDTDGLDEIIAAHLPPDAASQARSNLILERATRYWKLGKG